jgi:hypothetical protein
VLQILPHVLGEVIKTQVPLPRRKKRRHKSELEMSFGLGTTELAAPPGMGPGGSCSKTGDRRYRGSWQRGSMIGARGAFLSATRRPSSSNSTSLRSARSSMIERPCAAGGEPGQNFVAVAGIRVEADRPADMTKHDRRLRKGGRQIGEIARRVWYIHASKLMPSGASLTKPSRTLESIRRPTGRMRGDPQAAWSGCEAVMKRMPLKRPPPAPSIASRAFSQVGGRCCTPPQHGSWMLILSLPDSRYAGAA